MTNREAIRSAMNAGFTGLPEWLQVPFLPFQENVILLLDGGHDDLARRVVAAIYPPTDWTAEQITAFDEAKAEILAGIDDLMADAEANDPLRSPEAIALIEDAAERRSAS
jgi:hypothetical protein